MGTLKGQVLHSQFSAFINERRSNQSNVLIDDEGNACLCDFGLSRILQSTGFTTKSIAGTCRWMAIELTIPDDDVVVELTEATDVWAFGMTALEVSSSSAPATIRG